MRSETPYQDTNKLLATQHYPQRNSQSLARVLRYFFIALFAFISFYIALYPGYMSGDSLQQYTQSLTHNYNDWHPPIMAGWWSVLNLFFHGPQGLLFFHLVLLWGCLAGLAIYFRAKKTAGLFLLIGFVPWIANFEGLLWKDMGMAYSLLVACTLIIVTKTKNVTATLMIIATMLYAFMVRANAFFAIIPIFWLFIRYLRPHARFLPTILYTLILLVIFQACAYVINYKIIHAYKKNPEQFILVDDLVHMSLLVNKNLLPFVEMDIIKNCAKVPTSLFCIRQTPRPNSKKYSSKDWQQINRLWLKAVVENPIAYLSFRTDRFLNLMQINRKTPFYTTPFCIEPNSLGLVKSTNILTSRYESVIHRSVHLVPLLFKPYFWLFFSVISVILSLFLSGDGKTILCIRMLVLSSLLYILGYFPLAPAADFRYIYWSILAINLAVVLFFVSDKVHLALSFKKRTVA